MNSGAATNTTQRTFRLFVSSTFSDFEAEREALHEHVFPHLRALCERHGARFQAIDLRWGVSEDAAADQRTMEICLEEVRRCLRLSPRPSFLVLLGNRYGWLPVPARIPAAEFEAILEQVADPSDSDLLRKWFRRDENAVPAEYRLQPRRGEYADYTNWQTVERRLHRVIAEAASATSLPADALARYISSATHQEIREGALDSPSDHAFCYIRNLQLPPGQEPPAKFFDLDGDGNVNQAAAERLDDLWTELSQLLPKGHVREYEPALIAGGPAPEYIAQFAADVTSDLGRTVEAQLMTLDERTAVDTEVEAHHSFGISHTRQFVGREQTVERILRHVDGSAPKPLVVHGRSGSGKTALMARVVQQLRARETEGVLAYRFIGATPASTEIMSLLVSLSEQIEDTYGLGAYPEGAEGDAPEPPERFARALGLATAERPVVVILDAVDQLSPSAHAHSLEWVPRTLPPNVRLIISALERQDIDGAALRTARAKLDADFVQVEAMSLSEGEEMLDRLLDGAGRALTAEQRADVLGAFERCPEGRALFLKLAFEEARRWTSYDGLPTGADDIPGLADTVEGVIEDMLARVMAPEEHGAVLPERTLSSLRAARYGLTEDELLDVLSQDEDVMADFASRSPQSPDVDRLPAAVWSRLYLDLDPYLTRRQSGEAVLIDFFHRQVGEVVERLFLSEHARSRRHQALVDYFISLPSWLDVAQRRPAVRKVSELVHHCLGAGDFDALENTLTDPDFLEAKAEGGLVFELAADISRACAALPPHRLWARKMRILHQGLQEDIYFLAQHPQQLFQCLWNRVWWYDSEKGSDYYQEPEGGWGPSGPPWEQPEPRLCTWMERWRELKESRQPGFYWLRSLLPSTLALGGTRIATLRGHTEGLWQTQFMPDGRRVVTCSGHSIPGDHTVRVWDVSSGDELMRIEAGGAAIQSVAVSPDGRMIASSGADPAIRIWDAETGALVRRLDGHGDIPGEQPHVRDLAWSPDSRFVASASWDMTARVFDVKTGRGTVRFEGHAGWVEMIAFSPNGQLIASAGTSYRDTAVRIWDARSGDEMACLRAQPRSGRKSPKPSGIGFIDDDTVVVGHDESLRVWSISGGNEVLCIPCEMSSRVLAISRCRRYLVEGCREGAVRLWDMQTWDVVADLQPAAEKGPLHVALSPDAGSMACILRGSTTEVAIFDLKAGAPTPELPASLRAPQVCEFSPDGQWAVFAGETGTGHVLDISRESPRCTLTGHTHMKMSRPSAFFSPDRRHLSDGLSVWSLDGEKLVDGPRWTVQRRFQPFMDDGALFVGQDAGRTTAQVIDLETGAEKAWLTGHYDRIHCACLSPDGRLAMTGCGDGTAHVWSLDEAKRVSVLNHDGARVLSVNFTRAGTGAAVGCADGTLWFWTIGAGEPIAVVPGHSERGFPLVVSPDGELLATCDLSGSIALRQTRTGELISEVDPECRVRELAFSDDGTRLVCASDTVRILTVPELDQMRQIDIDASRALFTHNDRLIAVAEQAGEEAGRVSCIAVWDTESGERLRALHRASGSCRVLGVVPDTGHVVILDEPGEDGADSEGRSIITVDPETGETQRCTSLGRVTTVEASPNVIGRGPNGRTIIVGVLKASSLRIHEMRRPEAVEYLRTERPIESLSGSSDGRTLALRCDDGSIPLYDIRTLRRRNVIPAGSAGMKKVLIGRTVGVLNPGAESIETYGRDAKRDTSICDVDAGAEIATVAGEPVTYGHEAASADGTRLAIVRNGRDSCVVWDSDGRVHRYFDFFDEGFIDGVICPDADRVAFVLSDGSIRTCCMHTGAMPAACDLGNEAPTCVAVSPDGSLLATGCESGHVCIFEAGDLALVREFQNTDERVRRVHFLCGAERVLVETSKWIRVHAVDGGEVLGELPRDDRKDLDDLAVSPEGSYLARSWRGHISIYDGGTLELTDDMPTENIGGIPKVAVSDTGLLAYTGSPKTGGAQIHICSLAGAPIKTIEGHSHYGHLMWAGEGSILLEHDKYMVGTWDWITASQTASFTGVACGRLRDFAVIQSGALLFLSSSGPPPISMIDTADFSQVSVLRNRHGDVNDFRFSADGQLCATQHSKATCLWRVETGELARLYEGVTDAVAAIEADGPDHWLAAMDGATTGIRNAATGEEVAWAPGKLENVRHHPSGRICAGASRSGLQMWKLEGGETQT